MIIPLHDWALKAFLNIGEGVRRAASADFSGLPETPNWDEVLCFALLIDGYETIGLISDKDVAGFHREMELEFQKTAEWSGSVLELWIILFWYNRQNKGREGVGFGEGEAGRIMATSVYQALRSKLMNPNEIKDIKFILNEKRPV